MAAYISANALVDDPDEASIDDRADLSGLIGVTFFRVNTSSWPAVDEIEEDETWLT